MKEQQHVEASAGQRMGGRFVTGASQPFIGDLLQALGLNGTEGITALSLVLDAHELVRVNLTMLVKSEQVDALADVLRQRSYVLMEVLNDEAPQDLTDSESTAS